MHAELSVLFAAVIGLAAAGESSVTETVSTRNHHPAQIPSALPSNWGHGPVLGTETLTTYTTVTTCPVTIKTTDASSVYYTTTLETSTIVVTSCKGGCHHTRNPTYVRAPSGNMTWHPHGHHTPAPPVETITTVFPTTITTTMTSFVPTSVPITDRGSTYYSTWLTTTLITTVTVSTCTSTYEVPATPSAAPFPPIITYIPIPSTYFPPAISSTSDSCPSATTTVTNDGVSGTTCAPDTTSTETQTVYLSGSQTIEQATITRTQTVTVTADAGSITTTSDAGPISTTSDAGPISTTSDAGPTTTTTDAGLITTTTDAGPTTTTTTSDVVSPAGTGGIAAPSGTGGAASMGKREWYGMGGKWYNRVI